MANQPRRVTLASLATGAVATASAVAGGAAIINQISKIEIPERNSPVSGGDLRYPDELESYKYYVTFGFKQYQRRSVFDAPYISSIGNIRLPIPANIVDQIKVNYEDVPSPLAVGAGLEYGLNGAFGPRGPVGGAIGAGVGAGIAAVAGVAGSGLINVLPGGGLIGAVGGAAAQNAPFILQPLGLAVNPFLTVLFKSPTFKRHSFSWRLSANNPKESETINEILKTFRFHMLPDMAKGGLFLTYPDICDVTFQPEDSWLYKFKPCVVEGISINFAPNGQPSFFGQTNAPTDIQFTVNLLEIEYWLRGDIV